MKHLLYFYSLTSLPNDKTFQPLGILKEINDQMILNEA